MSRFKLLLAAVFICLTLAPLGAEIFEQVLVKVNGDIITKTEFEQRQVAELRNRPELGNVSPTSPELRKAVAEITPDLILAAVDELLLVQRGRELGWAMGDEQFNTWLVGFKKQNNLDDDAMFQAALKQEGMTMADLRRNIEKAMLVSNVQRAEVNDKIGVTEEEAKAYYAEHAEGVHHAFRSDAARDPHRGANDRQGRERRAGRRGEGARRSDLRARLLGGEPFARLAADFSAAPSRANGGLIGPLRQDELAPAFQKVLEPMKVGDITEPIRTTRGYQLLKLESRTETRVRSFADARGAIGDRVAETKRQGELMKYLERLRSQATVTWRNDELKRAYDQALAKRQAGAPATPAP